MLKGTVHGANLRPQIERFLFLVGIFLSISIVTMAPAISYAATPAAWSLHPSADEAKTWREVVWAPELKLFVSISSNSVMTSPDGTSWTFRTTPTGSWSSIAWSAEAGKFVAVGIGSSNNMIYSSDGINWATAPIGVNALNAVTWSPERHQFVAVGISVIHSVVIAPDLTVTPSPAGSLGLTGVTWANNDAVYVATAGGTGLGKTYRSADGLNWTLNNTPPVNGPWNEVVYAEDKDLFVIVGTNGVMTSSDGVTWVPRTSPLSNLLSITYSPENSEFVAVGDGGGIQTSPDGANWTVVPLSTTNNWRGITWSPELSRYVGAANTGTDRVLVGLVPKISDAPLNLAVTTSSAGKADLSWTAPGFDGNSAITGYRIERSVNGGAFTTLAANITGTTFQDIELNNGTSYAYRAFAINAMGESLASNEAEVTTGQTTQATATTLAETGTNQYGVLAVASALLLVGLASIVALRKVVS